MKKPVRLDISAIGYDDKCRRKPHMEILLRINESEKDFEENKYTISGKILHEILQSTFTYDFSLVKYYYLREGLNLENAIRNTMNLLSERWKNLLDVKNENYAWFDDFEMQS